MSFSHSSPLSLLQPHRLDAQFYIQKYYQLLRAGAAYISNAILAEMDNVTKSSSAQFRAADFSVLGNVNADFLVTASNLAPAVDTLGYLSDQHPEYPHTDQSTVTSLVESSHC